MDAPFWDHVAALRQTFLRVLAVIGIGVVCCLIFYPQIFDFLTAPLVKSSDSFHHQEVRRERITNALNHETIYTLPPGVATPTLLSNGVESLDLYSYRLPPGGYLEIETLNSPHPLVVLSPVEGLLMTFKVSFWIGLVASSPFWIYVLMKFITPALRREEKRLIFPFFGLSALFMGSGLLMTYYVTIPLANQYLHTLNASLGQNLWGLTQYLDYTLFLLLANALAFEIGVVLLFLVHFGVLTAEAMRDKRRHMIVVAFIVGALLTPPDILTQFMLAIPLIGLYELTILYALFRRRGCGEDRSYHAHRGTTSTHLPTR